MTAPAPSLKQDGLTTDLCIIGGGTGGAAVALAAAQLGLAPILVTHGERRQGPVALQALRAAARRRALARSHGEFGLSGPPPELDFPGLLHHLRDTMAARAAEEAPERLAAFGVTIIRAEARFAGPRLVQAGGRRIEARRIVIATGSRPIVPAISGLAEAPYLTGDDLGTLAALPAHLAVLGGNAEALALAQTFRRLGAAVTVLAPGPLLPGFDSEMATLLRDRLAAEGIALEERVEIRRISREGGGVAVLLADQAGDRRLAASHLLLAADRAPDLERLDLDAAKIWRQGDGLVLDPSLRTTNPRVYAVGGAACGRQSAALATHHAAVVLQHALFRRRARRDDERLPRLVLTDPELAETGMGEAEARISAGGGLQVLRAPFADNDRARAEREASGLVKLLAGRGSRVLGASILGARAGELIQSWAVAMAAGFDLRRCAGVLVDERTLSETNRRAALRPALRRLLDPRLRRLARFLARLP